jgi:alcohol dehydrogenase class IV
VEYFRLQQGLDVVPSGLNDLTGATEDHVDELARRCLDQQEQLVRCNPRLPTRDAIASVYRDALYNWE